MKREIYAILMIIIFVTAFSGCINSINCPFCVSSNTKELKDVTWENEDVYYRLSCQNCQKEFYAVKDHNTGKITTYKTYEDLKSTHGAACNFIGIQY